MFHQTLTSECTRLANMHLQPLQNPCNVNLRGAILEYEFRLEFLPEYLQELTIHINYLLFTILS